MRHDRVGRVTVASALIALGSTLLLDNLTGSAWGDILIRFWPVILIGLGLEYLLWTILAERQSQPRSLRFDLGGVILLAFILVAVSGYSAVQRFEHNGWTLNVHDLPFWGDDAGPWQTQERTVSLPVAPGAILDIQATAGTIEVTGTSPDDQVHVRAVYPIRSAGPLAQPGAPPAPGQDDFRLDTVGGARPRIEVGLAPGFHGRNPIRPVRLYVQTPAGLGAGVKTTAGAVDVRGLTGNVRIETTAGSVKARDLGGNVSVRTEVGTVEVQDVAGLVEARTGGGAIRVERFQGGTLESGFGMVRATDWTGADLHITSNTGSVQARTQHPVNGGVSIRTNVGQIELAIPRASNAQFWLDTEVGSLQTPAGGNFTISRNGPSASGRGTLGTGEARVELRSDTGRIELQTW